jgi:hypothetical protein
MFLTLQGAQTPGEIDMLRMHALVISPDIGVLRQIQAAFRAAPDVALALCTEWSPTVQFNNPPNILIMCTDTPTDHLRRLRADGYRQPALILMPDMRRTVVVPLDDDLRPVENVAWEVMRTGRLKQCAELLIETAVRQ